MKKAPRYNVVFEYTLATRAYAGYRTWTSFENKKQFEEWYTPERQTLETVVEQGITQERAMQLFKEMSIGSALAACAESSKGPDDKINGEVMMGKYRFLRQHIVIS